MSESRKILEDENLKRMLKMPPKHHAPLRAKKPQKAKPSRQASELSKTGKSD